jgi:hypothetical protein
MSPPSHAAASLGEAPAQGAHATAPAASSIRVNGHVVVTTNFDESSLSILTTQRLCPGRKVSVRVDGTTRSALVLACEITGLAANAVTYAVRLSALHEN